MTHNAPSFVCIGKILGPQGLQGALRICPYTATPDALMSYKLLYAGDERKALSITRIKPGRQKEVIIQCTEIQDRTAAETLKGARLWVSRSVLPELEEEEYYYTDLVGLSVRFANTAQEYGTITAVHNFGAGDVLALSLPDKGTLYIPFQKRVVLEVNCKEGYVVIDPNALDEMIETASDRKEPS